MQCALMGLKLRHDSPRMQELVPSMARGQLTERRRVFELEEMLCVALKSIEAAPSW